MARILKIVKEMLSEPSTMQHNKIVKVLKYFDMKPRKMNREREKREQVMLSIREAVENQSLYL